jgi:hypothetical protein
VIRMHVLERRQTQGLDHRKARGKREGTTHHQ